MVVKTCPSCKGTGYLQLAPRTSKGWGHCVKVDPGLVLEDLRAGKTTVATAKKFGIGRDTVRLIGNGTWAGFRKQ